jgi:thiamine monophosphate synthase
VHSLGEARTAASSGADGVVIGNIWDTPTHPGRPALGVDLLRRVAALGLPTWAIGGVTPERAREARDAGAHGVAAISALWSERRPYAAAGALLDGIRFPGES